jgi:methionyl-tRNA formyltransferase
VLARLLDARYDVPLVLTRPDRTAGRGLRLAASPVKQLALDKGCEVLQPPSLKLAEVEQRLRDVRPRVLVVVAYGLLVPASILRLPAFGCVNVHASLLPRWRGAAPVQRALLAGDACTGVSIMKMDEGLDTGPVYEQRRLDILPDDDAGTLQDKLSALGAEALLDVLQGLREGRARATPQPDQGATYAAKIDKREARLDWTRPAVELERAVRAFRPAPGAAARLGSETIKIWRAEVLERAGEPGRLLDASALVVACGTASLRILELQRPGGRRLSTAEFLRGHPLAPGTRLR